MSNRFKFRGMDKHGNWHYGYLLTMHAPHRRFIMDRWHSASGEATIKDELFQSIKEVIPETVGLYAGRNDSDGRPIYEDDIVEASIYCDEDPQVLKVRYLDGCFLIDYADEEGDYCPVGWFVGTLKVVGNGHENQN